MGFSAGTGGSSVRPSGTLILSTLRVSGSPVSGSVVFSVPSFQ